MATAPTPGVGKRNEEASNARKVMTITVKGSEPVTIALNNIPISERLICRKATGLPLDAFIGGENAIGEDSVVVLWWLGRRGNGEEFLTFAQACDEWPTDLQPDDVEVSTDDPKEDATDPEA